jgi:hypothetical protein
VLNPIPIQQFSPHKTNKNMTLLKAKDIIAEKHGFINYLEMHKRAAITVHSHEFLNEVSEEYAKMKMADFGNWLGFKYYRVNNWLWREIKNESNTITYSMTNLIEIYASEK